MNVSVFHFHSRFRLSVPSTLAPHPPTPQLDGKNDDFWICVADQQIVVGRGSFVWKHIILVAELRKFQARLARARALGVY